MAWPLIITSSAWLGFEISQELCAETWDYLSVLGCGIPLGFTLSSWLFFFARHILPHGSGTGLFMSIVMGGVAVALNMRRPKKKRGLRKLSGEFLVLMSVLMCLLYRVTDISMLKNGTASSGTTFSDIPFHGSLITSFAYGGNSGKGEMQTPFYLGESLCYPIIPDFHSATLIRFGGCSLRVSISVPTMMLLLSVIIGIHSLAGQFTRRRYVPELAVVAYFLASGSGWRYFFLEKCRKDVNANLCHCFCPGRHTFWIHSLIHYLLPQRSAMYSQPLCLFMISLLVGVVKGGCTDTKSMLITGIMMGLMPMISAHAYIAVGQYALFLVGLTFPYKRFNEWKGTIICWCWFGVTAIVISAPQIMWLLRSPREGFMKILPIWLETDNRMFMGFFTVWWMSLGAFLVVAIVLVWFTNNKEQNMIYIPSVCVWVVGNIIRYQPGAMDNTKVLISAWLGVASIAVVNYLTIMFSRGILTKIAVVSVALASSFGGVVCIYKAVVFRFPLYNDRELRLGQWIMENSRSDAAVLCSGWHSNVAMSIAGKLVTIGYGGWVWTHGLNINKRNSMIKKLIDDRENPSLFEPHKIEYALSKSDDHSRGFNFPVPPPGSHWMLVLDIDNIQLYRLLRDI